MLHQALYALALGVVVFCATNIDTWGLLVALSLADRQVRTGLLTAALLLALVVTLGLGALGGLAGRLLTPSDLRLLGVIPVALGLHGLLRRGGAAAPASALAGCRDLGWYFLLVLATGADNVSVFAVAFARLTPGEAVLLAAVQLALAPALVTVATGVRACCGRSRLVRRCRPWLSSAVLVLVGATVLAAG
ncbi:hypothetical protein GCM10010430_06660 [Kitasatospora cystarginea]|uniref:Cadmium transporter n=1 Tax=Kitasatospora cystarginea TaxID=58350 RepID=A0ABN3DEZ7_9ACTN